MTGETQTLFGVPLFELLENADVRAGIRAALTRRGHDPDQWEALRDDPVRDVVGPREELVLKTPPESTRCSCCNRTLRDAASIAAGQGKMCREGRCKKKRGG